MLWPQSALAATNKRVERAPERQNARMGRGSSSSSAANAAISCGDWYAPLTGRKRYSRPAARAAASMLALVGWLGPSSKSGRLLITLRKPARAASAIASGCSCGATQTSGATGRKGSESFMDTSLLRQGLLDRRGHQAHVSFAG